MKTRLSQLTVAMIASLTCMGSTAGADVISIDFNRRNEPTPSATASGTVTDANGHTSLPGQTGYWNELLMGVADDPETLYQTSASNTTLIGSLKKGDGTVTGVSFSFNTNNATHHAYDLNTTTRSLLHTSWVGLEHTNAPVHWILSGLEPNTVYRLRMFGRESNGAPASMARFTATGATSDSGSSLSTRNYVDLSVKSTAGGEVLGTLENRGSEFAAWSGMQIEWDVTSVISIDFDMASTNYAPGLTAYGTVADLNGALSFPGQAGTWNAVLVGKEDATSFHDTNNTVAVVSLLDGGGDATTVSFSFNTTKQTYTAFANAYGLPNRTALHRDCIYSANLISWEIAGLQPSTEYTLKLFGFQETAGTRLFATFSATGQNTASGTTSASQNYVDLVVTSTAGGVITGEKNDRNNGTWSAMQIQSSQPFPKPNPDLISIDFDFTASLPTQSGLNVDANGHTSLPGQSGTWNSLLLPGGNWNPDITASITSGTLKDGVGNDTSVSLVINPDGHQYWSGYNLGSHLVQRDFIGVSHPNSVNWQLSGLEPSTLYRLRMFGRQDSPANPVTHANFSAMGSTTNVASTYFKRNQADLWVTSTSEGTISGAMGAELHGAWSGMQIEWNVEMPPAPPLISIDLGYKYLVAEGTPGTVNVGPVASWTQVDMNGDQSLPGQIGNWNELLTGKGDLNTSNHPHNDKPHITGLLDGEGNATGVAFVFNTGGINYTTFADPPAQPRRTALHRDAVYVDGAKWQISGLASRTEYTIRFFGLQTTGPTHFGAFSATGMNTVSGSNTVSQNYVDLVVTSTVSGDITGTLNKTTSTVGSLSGLQIQASGSGELFPLTNNLISLDFETADTASKTATASGIITDSNGDSSWGQVGIWNSIVSGSTTGGDWQSTTLQPSIYNMFDGVGNETTVDFHFNTGTPVSYNVGSFPGALLGDMFTLLAGVTSEVSWQLTGLQPYAYYTLRMFGQVGVNPSAWEAYGAEGNTAGDTNTSLKNFVDLTVPANGGGVIKGKQIFTGAGGAGGASWTGMQILKLADTPYKPKGSMIRIR